MPAPYSEDLRRKALKAMETERMTTVSKMFSIHRDTLRRWQHRANEGHYCAKSGYQTGHNSKIKDEAAFRAFVDKYGHKTQAEMAQLWPEDISESAIARMLKKIGYTRKKNLCLSRTGRRQTQTLLCSAQTTQSR